MQRYNPKLKENSRSLRTNMTDAEQVLWQHIRCKKIHGVQFYRQKPLFAFVVDFYCPAAKLVIELDGSQHFAEEHQVKDLERDAALAGAGLRVLRFDNRQILLETEAVLEVIDLPPELWTVRKAATTAPGGLSWFRREDVLPVSLRSRRFVC